MKKKLTVLIVLIALVIIGLAVSGYYLYSGVNSCTSKECFDNSLSECRKTSYISDSTDTVLEYVILGSSGGNCEVNVKMLQIKRGVAELSALEGKEMVCSVALGLVTAPEANLKNCHGILKEEIQNVIIKRMHGQIVENLGQISEGTSSIL